MSVWLKDYSGKDKKEETQLGDYLIIVILRTKKKKIDESLNLAVIGNEKIRMNSRGIGVFGKA